MDRAAALKLYTKLLALADPERGGTPAERAVAAAKAERLRERHGLAEHEAQQQRQRAARPRPQQPAWRAPARGPAERWAFNPNTGEASANVKVEWYRDRGNWKIEVPADVFHAQGEAALREQRNRERLRRLDDLNRRRRRLK